MPSTAKTVDQYLAQLPADRRAALEKVREVIRANVDGYEEGVGYGMISYHVPLSTFPAGYHCAPGTPLPCICVASQKSHMSIHMMGLYLGGEAESSNPLLVWFRAAWAKTGKKLDMGKACIRFKKIEDLPLDVIGEAVRRLPAKKYVAIYESMLALQKDRAAARKAAKSSGAKKTTSATAKTAAAKKPAAKSRAAK